MRWHSIHVHYHCGDFDDLLLDAVRPLFARIAGQVDAAYYVRHWLHGPHLRLNVRTATPAFEDGVRPLAEEVLGGHLAAHPSDDRTDPRRLLPLHRRLAELEWEDGPLLPWRPDNSMHVAPYDRRLHVLKSEAAADVVADFLTDSTDAAFEMTRHIRDGGQRLRLAFDLMTAVAHTLTGTIRDGFVSYRAHAEWFLARSSDAERQRVAWDRHYRAHAPALLERVRNVLASLDAEGAGGVPFVASWAGLVSSYRLRGQQLAESGLLDMNPPPDPRLPALQSRRKSEFHRALTANEYWTTRVMPSPWFTGVRLVLNCTYLHLTRLGLTPMERFLLCHLLADTVEEMYGVTAVEQVRLRATAAGGRS